MLTVLSEAMAFYGLHRDFEHAGYFPTTQNEKMFEALKVAVQHGRLVVLSGIVGCGKSKLLRRIKDDLQRENHMLVSKSMALAKDRITIETLVIAMFHDLSTEREVAIPGQAEKRERKLLELISKRKKPVVLLVDEAHDVPRKTLIDLKRLSELVEEAGETLSVVLAGHPKLKNELSRATMEEVGSHCTFFALEGVKGVQRPFISWLLAQCGELPERELLTEEAAELMAARLVTPLQIMQYLGLAFEEAYQVGQKPVTAKMIEGVLAQDINGLESTMTRSGYGVKVVAELVNVRPTEIRSFLPGRLSASRAQELREEMLAVGIPL
jgi:type II secretory pathway predicted ATPase ExeA